MNAELSEDVLFKLKALADESRLTLLRLLAESEYSVGDLAQRIKLAEPTVSHHLARLREAGLVNLRMAGNQRFYRLNPTGLENFKRLVAEIEHFPPAAEPGEQDGAWIAALGWSEEDQQILRAHTSGKKLTNIPAKQKKVIVILHWLSTLFQPDRLYTEAEVNGVLKAAYAEDYVSLRRDLIDYGYLRRERGGGKYWLTPVEPEVTSE